MPAKKKTVKKAAVKKAVAKKPIKKIVKPAKKVRKAEPKITPEARLVSGLPLLPAKQPEFRINQIFADHMTVFGLANDQRVYRWNPRAGVWVLHKEGEQP